MAIPDLTYDPLTGKFFRFSTGDRAGGSDYTKGYRRIMYQGKRYKEHVLAWYFYYGTWPKHQIDHINGIKDDNRISNLRDVSQSKNLYNKQKAHKNSTTGFLGVSKSGEKFVARLRVGPRLVHLGTFNTPEEAHLHYMEFKDLVQAMD